MKNSRNRTIDIAQLVYIGDEREQGRKRKNSRSSGDKMQARALRERKRREISRCEYNKATGGCCCSDAACQASGENCHIKRLLAKFYDCGTNDPGFMYFSFFFFLLRWAHTR